MATCKDCLHYDVCKSYGVIMRNSLKLKMTEKVESKCPYKLFKSRTIKTNADRIRAMNDEELAKILDAFTAYYEECNRSSSDVDCKDCELYKVCSLWEGNALEWLKQPAEQKVIKNYKKVVDK